MTEPIISTDIKIFQLGVTFEEQNGPVKRETFLDYFPNVCRSYKGLIFNATFQSKMERVIKDALKTTGTFAYRCAKESVPSSGAFNLQREQIWQDYLRDVKNQILIGISVENWNDLPEMSIREELNNQSKNYFKVAGKEAAIQGATFGLGKGIKFVSKKINTKSLRLARGRIPNTGLSASERVTTIGNVPVNHSLNTNMTLNNSPLARNVTFKGLENNTRPSITLLEFNAVDTVVDRSENIVGDMAVDTKEYDSFDCLGLGVYNVDQEVNDAINTVTDFVPIFSWPNAFLNVVGNTLLGVHTALKGKRIQEMETDSSNRVRNFNTNLKQIIFNDLNFLNLPEVAGLIEVCGLKEMI